MIRVATACAVLVSLIVVAGCDVKRTAPAKQSLAQVRTKLEKVPPGSWSQYSIRSTQQELSFTVSLVENQPGGHVIEYLLEGRAGAPMTSIAIRSTYPWGKSIDDPPLSSLVQVAAFPPMQQPTDDPLFSAAKALPMDSTNWVADGERVTTPAGSFVASHFRRQEPDHSSVEVWVASDIVPTGLIRMREVSAHQEETITELVAVGTAAAARVTAQPEPFDQDLMMRQMLAGLDVVSADGTL